MRPLSRRAFIALAAGLAVPRWARGQAARRVYRVGWLGAIYGSKESKAVAFVQRLRELGLADAGGRLERLPSFAQWTEAGGLMSYGFNFPQMWRSAADMVGKILRGTRPGDSPMEQPTTYELAINAATARKLGIRIPESIRVRVDRIIDH